MILIICTISMFGILHFAYLLYAVLFTGKQKTKELDRKLSIHHVVCFHNEEAFIRQKLENCYKIDYPDIRHTFVNDNSTDKTLYLLKKYQKQNTLIINNETNIGKNQSQIKSVKQFDSDLILFTDANVFIEGSALRKLVTYFDSKTGGVTGNVQIKTASDEVEFSGKYWNLEKIIKKFQANYGSVIGFDGGFYCVRTKHYNLKRENELSDFETAFLLFEQGLETQYAHDAKAVEIEKRTLKSSYKARMRASNRVFWSFRRIFRYICRLTPTVITHFVFHKILRYCFIVLFVLFSPLIFFYTTINLPWLLVILLIPYVFRLLWESLALFVGGVIALTGKEYVSWSDKKI